jgi:hypothetical protein
MDWGAQEVLCSQVLPSLSCLRMLRLGASNLYLGEAATLMLWELCHYMLLCIKFA